MTFLVDRGFHIPKYEIQIYIISLLKPSDLPIHAVKPFTILFIANLKIPDIHVWIDPEDRNFGQLMLRVVSRAVNLWKSVQFTSLPLQP